MKINSEVKYAAPNKDRVIELFKAGKSFYEIMEDQHCTVRALYEVLRAAYFDKKI